MFSMIRAKINTDPERYTREIERSDKPADHDLPHFEIGTYLCIA